jgi:hypothetical protein
MLFLAVLHNEARRHGDGSPHLPLDYRGARGAAMGYPERAAGRRMSIHFTSLPNGLSLPGSPPMSAHCESACDLTPKRLPTVTPAERTINSSIRCVAARGLVLTRTPIERQSPRRITVEHGWIVDVCGGCPGFATLQSFNRGAVNRNATLSKAVWERDAEIRWRAAGRG